MASDGCVCAEYWATHDGMKQAHQLLERMRMTKVPSGPYIEAATVEAVYQVRTPLWCCTRQRQCILLKEAMFVCLA